MVSLPMCQDCGHYKGQHFVKIGLVDSEAGYVTFCKFCKCKQFRVEGISEEIK